MPAEHGIWAHDLMQPLEHVPRKPVHGMGMGHYPGSQPQGGGSREGQFGRSRGPRARLTAWLRRPIATRLALGIAALAMLAVAAFVAATTRHPGHHRPGVTGP